MSAFSNKIIYTAIGAASITNEKVKELIEDLIQNNHYTEEEGKRLTDNFLEELRVHLDTLNMNFKVKIDDLLQKFGIPSIYTVKEDIEHLVNDIKEDPTTLLRLPLRK
jgi:polyhydroxyalkanoate synthesis regulator phasin